MKQSELRFSIEFLEEAEKFIDKLEEKSRAKVLYNLKKSQTVIDSKLFKKLNKDIWEFRTLYNKETIRLLAFWTKRGGEEVLVICTHGFTKKTNKIPKQQIKKAETLRIKYLND